MSIIPHIEYLLTQHDCVIVPGIGALLAHEMPAYYDEEEICWFPPARVISFNPMLSRTDGLIASSVARRDNISMNAAAAIVRTECDRLRQTLESSRTLSLGDAGRISLSSDGLMNFVPGTAPWLSPSTMWLPKMALKASKQEDSPAARSIGTEIRRQMRAKRIRRIASAAACILVLFALGWIVAKDLPSMPNIQFASIAPIEISNQDDFEDVFWGEISDEPAQVILAQEPETQVVKQAQDAKHFLIVASLDSQAEAERFVNRYNNLNLGILSVDGRFRVYAASGDSWEEMVSTIYSPEVSDNFDSAWVYTR